MAIKTVQVAPFSDVFFWAEKEKKAGWNECNDIFFDTEYFKYKGNREFYIQEVEYDVAETSEHPTDKHSQQVKKAAEIMLAWMKANNLEIITITGD